MTDFVTRIVACPQCAGPSRYEASNPYRPFCCERCRNIDLGAWANEEHRLPDETPQDDLYFENKPLQ
jgi:endogenous inhibitor of DNA gyrase (YacG/DUF329 family)